MDLQKKTDRGIDRYGIVWKKSTNRRSAAFTGNDHTAAA